MRIVRTRILARPICAALAAALILSGCSWMTRFAVTNGTDSPIKLLIAAEKSKADGAPGRACPIGDWAPLEVTAAPLGRWGEISWQKLPQERYTLDRQYCLAEIEIAPGESVSITGELTYPGHRRAYGIPGQLASLTIQSRDGEISSKGWEITKHFARLSDALYVYTYK